MADGRRLVVIIISYIGLLTETGTLDLHFSGRLRHLYAIAVVFWMQC